MGTILAICQIVAALGLLNVWLLRFSQGTPYRGGEAHSMREEFQAYGLPAWFTWVIGALKIGVAISFIAGLWISALVLPAALLLSVLMLGALAMHVKVHDPLKKSLPAVGMLTLALIIVWASLGN
ncbi:MAG: DoxX family protein [Gemmatimonadaceae bacterium]|nr:DoxX family protein [Gemmatimonadaceae bacterium]